MEATTPNQHLMLLELDNGEGEVFCAVLTDARVAHS
jgi:hypothetical protein